MTIYERLLLYVEKQGITKNKFSVKSSLSNGLLAPNRSIGSDSLEKIHSAFPNLNMDWVITGRGEMLIKPDGNFKVERTIGGKNLEHLRDHLKLSLSDFGRYFDLDKEDVVSLELGKHEPSDIFKHELKKIFDFGTSFWDDSEYHTKDRNWKNITLELLNSKRKIANPVYDEIESKKNKDVPNVSPKL